MGYPTNSHPKHTEGVDFDFETCSYRKNFFQSVALKSPSKCATINRFVGRVTARFSNVAWARRVEIHSGRPRVVVHLISKLVGQYRRREVSTTREFHQWRPDPRSARTFPHSIFRSLASPPPKCSSDLNGNNCARPSMTREAGAVVEIWWRRHRDAIPPTRRYISIAS